jgi:hypothetical protein
MEDRIMGLNVDTGYKVQETLEGGQFWASVDSGNYFIIPLDSLAELSISYQKELIFKLI